MMKIIEFPVDKAKGCRQNSNKQNEELPVPRIVQASSARSRIREDERDKTPARTMTSCAHRQRADGDWIRPYVGPSSSFRFFERRHGRRLHWGDVMNKQRSSQFGNRRYDYAQESGLD